MRVFVLGAGLIGVATAWYLRRAGHDVTVIDRQPAAGMETSFANGGQISVSHPEPWANPGAPLQVLRWLGREDAPLLFRPRLDWQQWSWGLRFLLQCLPGPTRRNTGAIAALALYSRERLRELRRDTGIEYDCLERGILHLCFDARSFSHAHRRAAMLRTYGIRAEVRDARQCIALEPALAGCRDTLFGGIYAPDDETGDAHRFTQALSRLCMQAGVEFRFGATVRRLQASGSRIVAAEVVQDGETHRESAQAYVVALGSYSPQLVRPLGERLPIFPVKGYSVTLSLADDAGAPRTSITDESRRIVCSRLGNRLRLAGTAELSGYDTSINAVRCEAILRRAREIFPALHAAGEPEYWAGLRPATPGNLPVIGRSRYENLLYNTGHGTLGWTLACGSGQALADIASGRGPSVAFPFRKP
ncbi:MAG: D-amino acid dehydrogenase [Pseudomonadota bacterium]|jgi:D-amino-acid dehydrogenase